MQSINWKSELDIRARRKATLRFVWMVLGVLILAGNIIPLASGEPLPLSATALFLVLAYMVIAFLFSRWQRTARLTPHMLMAGMALLFTYLCILTDGINTPVSHFIPLVPALASLLLRSSYCLVYGALVSILIAVLVVLDINGSIRNATGMDIQNGATLILTAIIVTTGSWFVAVHDERLIQAVKGKSGYDELTNLPNRYFLRNHYEKLVAQAAEEDGEKALTLINFGIDDFVKYNKSHGQENGDRLLVRAAQTLVSLAKVNKDLIIARNQGHAFSVIFAGNSEQDAQSIISKVQKGFDALKIIDTPGHTLSISAAVLLFDLSAPVPTGTEALIKANELLAWTQSNGPKQVQSFSGQEILS